jgi:hypothetical protein
MILQILLKAIQGAATEELKHLLDRFRELNGQAKHDKLVLSIKNSFELLKEVTDETKTKCDDTIVNIVLSSLPNE